MSSEERSEMDKVVTNGIRLAGDTLVVPGASLILDGQIGPGIARVAAGVAARVVFGPIGWLAVAADSYAKTTTGTGLAERLWSKAKSVREKPEDASEPTPTES